MLALLFGLSSSYKASYLITVSYSFIVHRSFGFKAGGTYNISIINSTLPYIITGLLNETEYNSVNILYDSVPTACLRTSPISKIGERLILSNTTSTIYGIIPTTGIYYLYYDACLPSSNYYTAVVSVQFANPDSLLDSRWYPCFTWMPIACVIFFVLLAAWLTNWFLHFSVQIYLHYVITVVLVLALCFRVIYYIEFMHYKDNDTGLFITTLGIIFRVLSESAVFFLLLVAAKGWCIIKDKIEIWDFALAFVYSTAYITFNVILRHVYLGNWEFAIILLEIVSLVLYGHELIESLNQANLQIIAHLLVISNDGINAESTPIYQKHILYNNFLYSIIAYFLTFFAQLIVMFFVNSGYWVGVLMDDLSDLVLLILFAFIFRIRSNDANGYTQFTTSESPAQEFELADIQAIHVNNDEFSRGGRIWEEGMPLPAPPSIITSTSVVTIQSPDGTNNVLVRPSDNQQAEEL